MDFVVKHMWVVLIFVISGGMLLWPLFKNRSRGTREVSPLEAVTLMNRRHAVILDVRYADDYGNGHLPNSRHIPSASLEAGLKDIEKFKSRPILLVGQGGHLTNAVNLLSKNGFKEVFSLRGGIAAWQQANMPVEKANG